MGRERRSQAICKGRMALEILTACSQSKVSALGSENIQFFQPGAGQPESHDSKSTNETLEYLSSSDVSKCPFASMKTAFGDPKNPWSFRESITPRPNSIHPPKIDEPDLNSPRSDRQERLSSRHYDPTSPIHETPSIEDPIAADSLPMDSYPPPSASGSASASKCPIRFMDQHSPEEIAAYFKNHKHEIPRSHEICVKRYQSNAQSIRQLDAKYGDLVSMIQGLGMKHRPLLPADDDMEIPATEQNLLERVEKWSDEIRQTPEGSKAETPEAPVNERENLFDRPLKEVRLGESPSRPWGISVPAAINPSKDHTSPTSIKKFSIEHIKVDKDKDTLPQDSAPDKPTSHQPLPDATPNPNTTTATATVFHCPHPTCSKTPRIKFITLHQLARHILNDHPSDEDQQQQPPSASPPAMTSPVFTGPVFIGYPLDQAVNSLQQLGLDLSPKANKP